MTFKIEISHFLAKVNPNIRNKTKSEIFPRVIFKSEI